MSSLYFLLLLIKACKFYSVFSKNMLFVSLIFSTVFLFQVLLTFNFIFIIFFFLFLPALGFGVFLVCLFVFSFFFLDFFFFAVRTYIIDVIFSLYSILHIFIYFEPSLLNHKLFRIVLLNFYVFRDFSIVFLFPVST